MREAPGAGPGPPCVSLDLLSDRHESDSKIEFHFFSRFPDSGIGQNYGILEFQIFQIFQNFPESGKPETKLVLWCRVLSTGRGCGRVGALWSHWRSSTSGFFEIQIPEFPEFQEFQKIQQRISRFSRFSRISGIQKNNGNTYLFIAAVFLGPPGNMIHSVSGLVPARNLVFHVKSAFQIFQIFQNSRKSENTFPDFQIFQFFWNPENSEHNCFCDVACG